MNQMNSIRIHVKNNTIIALSLFEKFCYVHGKPMERVCLSSVPKGEIKSK